MTRRTPAVLVPVAIVATLLVANVRASSGIRGVATWYDDGPGLYAAAGPALRTGDWRGRWVTVRSDGRSVRVRLTDWCACGPRSGVPTLLDLSADAFRELAPLSRGVIRVTVETGGPGPTLPPTDVGP